jgi:hypothetical protein
MKFLIIPDIHHEVHVAERLISTHPDHIAVLLGDYFDNYHDTVEETKKTAEWLRHSLQQPNRVHLMGNHDAAYRWSPLCGCPGWSKQKHQAVAKVLTRRDWDRIDLHHTIRREGQSPVVLSHAGFTLANLYGVSNPRDLKRGGRLVFLKDLTVEEHLQEIESKTRECLHHADQNMRHPLLEQGSRMGSPLPGGPMWLDWRKFDPIAGIDQVCGHTKGLHPRWHFLPNEKHASSRNVCIDTGLKSVALLEDGILSIVDAS